jgi:hypothetical protein
LRNNMHKQNNFSMFWTAEALLECYRLTSNKEYLDYGQRTLDELLMTQASWQPPYMYVNVLGGFGVLNADGEWNDSRESLFSELIIQYGKLLGKPYSLSKKVTDKDVSGEAFKWFIGCIVFKSSQPGKKPFSYCIPSKAIA